MVDPPKFKEWNLAKQNKALIFVISLALLYYSCNKYSNIFHEINSYYTFSSNIPKRFTKFFYQMDIIVSYKSIWHNLQVNTIAVIDEIVVKTWFHHFYISYDNMDFYENI